MEPGRGEEMEEIAGDDAALEVTVVVVEGAPEADEDITGFHGKSAVAAAIPVVEPGFAAGGFGVARRRDTHGSTSGARVAAMGGGFARGGGGGG